MSSMGLFEEITDKFVAEQRSNESDDNGIISSSVLGRLDKQFQDIMLAIHQVWGPKLVEMENKIMKLQSDVDKLLASIKNDNVHNTHNSRPRCLNLQFINKIASPIWTGDEIKGEGGKYVEVVLVDETGKVVDCGPVATAEVRIFAFKEDVDDKIGLITDDITRGSKGKKATLAGSVQLKLNKGIGVLANIKFRNSASHTSGMFRLQAQAADCFDDTVIKDAKTESFTVKDYRGKYSGKHYPPFLYDDICHLENIGRAGSLSLKAQGINTVEDFLIQLLKESDRPKPVVDGLRGKKWEATVKHARTCQLNEKMYCSIDSDGNNGVVFNLVGKVLGLILKRKYIPLDNLPDEAKANASKMEVAKIVQKQGLVSFDDESSLRQQFSQMTEMSDPSRSRNSTDQEDEVSKVDESCQPVLPEDVENVASSSNFTGCTSPSFFHFQEDFLPFTNGLQDMNECIDQEVIIDFDSLWHDSNTIQTASIDDTFAVESPVVVSEREVKKKLFILYTVSKWFLKFEKMVACDENGHKKRQRID